MNHSSNKPIHSEEESQDFQDALNSMNLPPKTPSGYGKATVRALRSLKK